MIPFKESASSLVFSPLDLDIVWLHTGKVEAALSGGTVGNRDKGRGRTENLKDVGANEKAVAPSLVRQDAVDVRNQRDFQTSAFFAMPLPPQKQSVYYHCSSMFVSIEFNVVIVDS